MEMKCPHCAELIKADATLCKHCKQPIVATVAAPAVVVVHETTPEVVITTTNV